MELDCYKLYEMLRMHPNVEVKFEAAPTNGYVFGLNIRVICYEELKQKQVLLTPDMMESARGSLPITNLISDMIAGVLKPDEEEAC